VRHSIKAFVHKGEKYYVAECLEIAVVTQGKPLDDTMCNLQEAVALHLEGKDPKEVDRYYVACFGSNKDLTWYPFNKFNKENQDFWNGAVDWYLQPCEMRDELIKYEIWYYSLGTIEMAHKTDEQLIDEYLKQRNNGKP